MKLENAFVSNVPVRYQDDLFKAEYNDLANALPFDMARLFSFMMNLSRVAQEGIEGAFAELGVWEGHTAKVLHYYAQKYNRKLYLFDTFQGLDKRDLKGIDENLPEGNFPTSVDSVKKYLGSDYLQDTRFCVGYFPDSITDECRQEAFSFVHIDCDLYKPICEALHFFYPRMNSGGVIFIHDYHNQQFRGAKKAVEEFCSLKGISPVLLPDVATTSVIVKNDRKPSDMIVYGLGTHLQDMLVWHPCLANCITRIIDKDIDKVGTRAVGVMVESPDVLRSMPVGTEIVVSAIRYFDEIESDIHAINPGLLCRNIDEVWQKYAREQGVNFI